MQVSWEIPERQESRMRKLWQRPLPTRRESRRHPQKHRETRTGAVTAEAATAEKTETEAETAGTAEIRMGITEKTVKAMARETARMETAVRETARAEAMVRATARAAVRVEATARVTATAETAARAAEAAREWVVEPEAAIGFMTM